MRVMATIAYDGSAFYGFQRQTSTPQTVTGQIESSLRQLQINTQIVGSGRTDRGVHAIGQVIHFDLPDYWHDLEKLRTILNRRLDAIQFRSLKQVPDDFHARFWAKRRRYRYLFSTETVSVFERNYITHYPCSFDLSRLNSALALFRGTHDFQAFCKTGSEVHTTVRTVFRAFAYPYKKKFVIVFEADGFLRSQVRMMVDAAMACARGMSDLETLKAKIDAKSNAATKLAPAQGLYLAKIHY